MSSRPSPPQKPGDRPARRPLGPFLLFTAALLLLLVLLGPSSSTREVTEDEFWFRLYTGQVETVVLAGQNRITGSFARGSAPGAEGEDRFSLVVPSTTEIGGLVRSAAARTLDPALTMGAFLGRIESGEVLPMRGYPIRVNQKDPGMERFFWQQRYFVEYQDKSGLRYAEVMDPDPVALSTSIQEAGGEVEQGLVFDLNQEEAMRTEEGYSFFSAFLYSFGPILLFIALFWFIFMRQMRGQGQGLMSFGRSRARLYNKEKNTNVTFNDVAGIDEAKEEVGEIIEFLKSPVKFQRLGGRIPRGVLLVGPPGAGKTLLAKAIAGEAEVPFLSISGSDFVEMFVGVGASRVRDLFKQAKESAPCIVFLDEIDAVGRRRGSGLGGGHDEREQTLNAILVEMDGFGTDQGIIVIAATNRPDVLDPALLRPGRFDRQIVIDLPDVKGREKILIVHARNVKTSPSVDMESIARGTPGFSGAELAAMVNEAAIIAVMRGKDSVCQEDLEEARDKVRFGRQKKSRVMDLEDKRITAYHEAGHAVLNMCLEHTEPIHKVTIIPRGMALGATMMLPERDRMHMSRRRLLDDLTVAYGGRIAEQIFCDDITAGAANDIQYATRLAKVMVTEWGMSDRLGPVNFADRQGSEFLGTEITVGKDHAEATVREIDEEVSRMLSAAHERAQQVIGGRRDMVERVAEALLVHETLSGRELRLLMEGTDPADLRPAEAEAETAPPAERPALRRDPAPEPGPAPFAAPGEEGLSPA